MLTDREQQILQTLPELPDDLAEAFDSMKLAILHHERDNWTYVSERDVVSMLNVLIGLTGKAVPLGETTLRDLQSRAINEALKRHGGNKPAAAKELGIALKTLYNKLAQPVNHAR